MRILESSLYVADLERSVRFYEELFGFPKLILDDRLCAFSVSGEQVLLLFRQGASREPARLPGGMIPSHDGQGQIHLAFSIDASEIEDWRARLSERGIEIESVIRWERGGMSVYFRDPDGHLLELVTPGCWAIY